MHKFPCSAKRWGGGPAKKASFFYVLLLDHIKLIKTYLEAFLYQRDAAFLENALTMNFYSSSWNHSFRPSWAKLILSTSLRDPCPYLKISGFKEIS